MKESFPPNVIEILGPKCHGSPHSMQMHLHLPSCVGNRSYTIVASLPTRVCEQSQPAVGVTTGAHEKMSKKLMRKSRYFRIEVLEIFDSEP